VPAAVRRLRRSARLPAGVRGPTPSMGQPHPQGLRGRPSALPALPLAHARGLVDHRARPDPPHPRPPCPPRPRGPSAATLTARPDPSVGRGPPFGPMSPHPDAVDVPSQPLRPGAFVSSRAVRGPKEWPLPSTAVGAPLYHPYRGLDRLGRDLRISLSRSSSVFLFRSFSFVEIAGGVGVQYSSFILAISLGAP